MTPDSSRFWPADGYAPGGPQPSFDKQYVRDHLEAIRWNKQPPVPSLPDEVVARTREKYLDAYRRLTGAGPRMTIRQQIDGLVREMVAKGILYEDASREFEARFISVALEEEAGSIGKAAERIGMHRNTLSRKIDEYKIKKP